MKTILRKRRWVKGILFVLLFIAIGAVIGAGMTMIYFGRGMHRPPPRRDAIVARMLEKMRERVAVTGDEEKRLTSLLEKHFDEILEVRRRSFDGMQEVFRRMDADVESVLGRERFQTWFTFKEERMARWRQRYERE